MSGLAQWPWARRITARIDRTLWTPNLLLLALAVFLLMFGEALYGGVRTNFFVETIGIDERQVLWMEGIREIPGLTLILLSALIMHIPLSRRASASVLVMGLSFMCFALVRSYGALVAMEIAASTGMHSWMPLQGSLGMSLAPRERSGRVLGTLAAVSAMASVCGVGTVALFTRLLPALSLRAYYVGGGVLIIGAAGLLWRLPTYVGASATPPPRLLMRRRYWLYYVLNFFEGSRKQVLGGFAALVLVQAYGLATHQLSALLLASALLNFLAAPVLGRSLDRLGERTTLGISYGLLVLCCAAYATIHQVWLLALLFICIKLLVVLEMGLSTYVNRIAPREELTPTLSAGISINHITSVAVPLLAGALFPIVGYEGIFIGAGGLILLSLPFTLSLRVSRPAAPPFEPVLAE
jgi:predicted MFS family arabinose efflux permease